MTAFEVKYRPVIVYADTFADLAAIPADLTLTKHAFILDTGDEYVLEPKSTVWQKLTDAEAAAIAELEAGLDANRIYNTASSAAVCSFSDGADGVPMKSLIAEIAPVQAGSGDPAPDNVRPISGWDGVEVKRTGKNLLENKSTSGESNGLTWTVNSDGSVSVSGTASANTSIGFNTQLSPQFIAKGSVTLACSARASYNPSVVGVNFQSDIYVNGSYVKTLQNGAVSSAFNGVITVGTSRLQIQSGTVISSGFRFYPQIEIGSSASSYEKYTGDIYEVTFPTPPGTVYGGTVDPVNGTLTVTDANIASYAGETLPGTWISDRDVYAEGTTPTTGAQVVYKLAEPLVYQLDPVTIESLLGTNNLFADTGDTSAEYCADPKMYIDSAIASAVAALS